MQLSMLAKRLTGLITAIFQVNLENTVCVVTFYMLIARFKLVVDVNVIRIDGKKLLSLKPVVRTRISFKRTEFIKR
jgi:hypothetical protein